MIEPGHIPRGKIIQRKDPSLGSEPLSNEGVDKNTELIEQQIVSECCWFMI